MKKINIQIKAQNSPELRNHEFTDTGSTTYANKVNKKKSKPGYILVKLQNTKDKGKILKPTGKNDPQTTESARNKENQETVK